ncbi:PTS sugar transporter subunit IIB [Pediococcus parvulus]|uniref:PTS sugar transporter subunit IIB n=1 Tax=Pediococcus parvulus TaxID=54062 RepID=UPI000709D64E|nr:PTS sugar transporter subunit IIB [Pediococcus parvulus]MCT3026752.1 PTS mannose/fructose/sorbose transporter subunit IIB [Pediococcus parvulus]GEL89845.1 PTS mannose transporter subunit IIC [Pediococcus parvulus]GHC09094.1 PTS mannose transporter subunit IIC [Pediococcus parvulus]
MPVVLARVDQRLIHGLIVNQWAQSLKAKRFMVVDDVVSQNEELKASMRMSKPAGTGMSIINTEKAITNFKNGNYDAQRVFILVKEPSKLLELIDAGIEIPKVNLGIMFAEDGRIPVTKFIALNDKEKADIKKIQDRGIPVTVQYVPVDPEENVTKYLK